MKIVKDPALENAPQYKVDVIKYFVHMGELFAVHKPYPSDERKLPFVVSHYRTGRYMPFHPKFGKITTVADAERLTELSLNWIVERNGIEWLKSEIKQHDTVNENCPLPEGVPTKEEDIEIFEAWAKDVLPPLPDDLNDAEQVFKRSKKKWNKPEVKEIDTRYELWSYLYDAGFNAVEDEIRAVIALALLAADDDELQRAGLKKIDDGR